jgi:Flp pilus assembly protein protease CpaA
MLGEILLIGLAIIWVIFASIEDLRKREVENWVSFSLIAFALGIRFFFSLFSRDFSFFYMGIIGLTVFFILGNLFYYSRIFAGADAKLMIALGAILPLSRDLIINFNIALWFLLFFLFIGAIYGVIWSLILMINHFKNFRKYFASKINQFKKRILFLSFLSFLFILFGFYLDFLIFFGILLLILPYILLFAKSIDDCCMVKRINVVQLTEGDWLVNDLLIGKNKIVAKWDGLTKEQINIIKKHRKTILVRYGIPFIPVFLISFIFLILFYFSKYFFFLF